MTKQPLRWLACPHIAREETQLRRYQLIQAGGFVLRGQAPLQLHARKTLPVGEQSILRACIQFPDGVTREQLTVLTGYKRSSRDAYIQRLREKGNGFRGHDIAAASDGSAVIRVAPGVEKWVDVGYCGTQSDPTGPGW